MSAVTTGIAALVVLSGLSIGSVATSFSVVKVAPYKGASWGPYVNYGSFGCSTAKIGRLPFFHPTTGQGGFAMSTKTSACSKNTSRVANYAAVVSEVTVYIPLHSYPGARTIIMNWTVNTTSTQSLVPGACVLNTTSPPYSYSACTQIASLTLYGGSFLWDLTSGAFAYPSNSWPTWQNGTHMNNVYSSGTFYNSSGGGSGGLPAHLTLSSWINVTMVKGDNYTLNAYFIGQAYTEVDGRYAYVVGGSASSSFALAGLGNGLDLRSITIL